MIASALPSDAPAIRRLLEQNGLPLEGWSDHLHTTLVIRRGDEVVACAALEVYADGALLRSVAVDASARGQGLGQRITLAALDMADTRQAAAVYLLTTTAEHFFLRFGFVVLARDEVPTSVRGSVEFTSACPASAIVMRKWIRQT